MAQPPPEELLPEEPLSEELLPEDPLPEWGRLQWPIDDQYSSR